MSPLILLAACAFFVSLISTPLLRSLALRWGFVDMPDELRKSHIGPIPRIGGVAIFSAYVAAFGMLALFSSYGGEVLRRGVPRVIAIGPAVLLVFIVGLYDDLVGMSAHRKLLGQSVAATYVSLNGLTISCLGSHILPQWVAVPLTILWLIGCTNAFNLIDGLDGLAGSVGFFASLSVFVAAVINSDIGLALATLPLAGALLGFLRYNFNPASVFMGDGGSLFIGFMLGCFALMWGQKTATLLGIAAPMIVLAFPLTDTILSLVRRLLRRVPVFRADRGHLHHRLLDRGFSPRQATDLICALCALLSVLAILTSLAERLAVAIVAVVLAGVSIAVHHLRYVEIEAMRRVLSRLRQLALTEMDAVQLQDDLESVEDLGGCLAAIEISCRRYGVSLEYAPTGRTASWNETSDLTQWQLRIPMPDQGCVYLRSNFRNGSCSRPPDRLVEIALNGIRRCHGGAAP
jgi:UDP-GlcNAc:undecaprenyl-phosphate GlcNAc-1-phosphate transferase